VPQVAVQRRSPTKEGGTDIVLFDVRAARADDIIARPGTADCALEFAQTSIERREGQVPRLPREFEDKAV
jgi:hypothetical protein